MRKHQSEGRNRPEALNLNDNGLEPVGASRRGDCSNRSTCRYGDQGVNKAILFVLGALTIPSDHKARHTYQLGGCRRRDPFGGGTI
jgi:hypothetical protein